MLEHRVLSRGLRFLNILNFVALVEAGHRAKVTNAVLVNLRVVVVLGQLLLALNALAFARSHKGHLIALLIAVLVTAIIGNHLVLSLVVAETALLIVHWWGRIHNRPFSIGAYSFKKFQFLFINN
jgi:hypothetical protein